MLEPTHPEYKILKSLYDGLGSSIVDDNDKNIDNYWNLKRAGFLDSFIIISSDKWKFSLSQKGIDYIESTDD